MGRCCTTEIWRHRSWASSDCRRISGTLGRGQVRPRTAHCREATDTGDIPPGGGGGQGEDPGSPGRRGDRRVWPGGSCPPAQSGREKYPGPPPGLCPPPACRTPRTTWTSCLLSCNLTGWAAGAALQLNVRESHLSQTEK